MINADRLEKKFNEGTLSMKELTSGYFINEKQLEYYG
jgi:hypothetical protein